MKLGVVDLALSDMSTEQMLQYTSGLGLGAVEIGAGCHPGESHSNPEELLSDKSKLAAYKELFKKYDTIISALSVHGNPVSPDKEQAKYCDYVFDRACRLANELELDTVITFSGCPGGSPGDKMPNWVTCAWPNEYLQVLDYQWNDVLIPYWTKKAELAKSYGVTKIALEMHPGFCVYNTETLLRLRNAVGSSIGANFDPSHLIWQGIDPVASIKEIGKAGAMYHFHAKDTKIDKYNTAINGVLDTKSYGDVLSRSWVFRSLGYGTDTQLWKEMISALQVIGYNHVLSIEHEDSYMTTREGLEKAISFLKDVMIYEPMPGKAFWDNDISGKE